MLRCGLAAIPALSLGVALCAAVSAQTLPQAHSVSGVASNDVLKFRTAHSAGSEIVSEVGPSALNVEVLELSPDERWGPVGVPEGNEWGNMRFL